MAFDIESAITNNWPATESAILQDIADEEKNVRGVDYAGAKVIAIARATADLYGESDVPEDIPDVAAEWIADRATLILHPFVRDWVAAKTKRSEVKNDATITNQDRLGILDRLRAELEKSVADNWEAAHEAALGETDAEGDDGPGVSFTGLYVNAQERAALRGPI